jgi:serine protease Do
MSQRYGFTTQEGVVISRVSQYSEAEGKGIQAGDIILEVNRQPVKDVREFERIVRKLDKGQPYLLLLSRERRGREPQEFIVTLRIPE